MKQLHALNSHQLTLPLAKPHPTPIPPLQPHPLKNIAIFKSKKRIKKVQPANEFNPSIGLQSNAQTRPMAKNELKQFVIGQLSNTNAHLSPLPMKAQQNMQRMKGCKLRCSTEGQQEQSLLFTFYPKQKLSQDQIDSTIMRHQGRRMEGRTFSLKNSPIVCYPHSNKILPKAFRIKTDTDTHNKRYSELPKQPLRENNQNTSLPIHRVRTFSMRSKFASCSNHQSQKLHKPVLQALQQRSP